MNVQEAYKSIITRPLRQRNEPLYVLPIDWVKILDEVREYQKIRDRPVWCAESEYMNFTLAGVEVRISE
jgi:hypothetical protein